MHGAPQRPMSARAHAERGFAGESRSRHWRSGSTSWTAATAASAAEREPNGPAYRAPSSATVRTMDRRGNGSTVSLTHSALSGLRERRL